ncbi:DUF1624 domain-containing protein [Patescibacteria group bacterium]|nr:DUF1624 domain-containing protein [Patescibacteria group bacterium]MBU1016136.1 DUF1624 domain-containing protein [Patescibacteria group bacterium]MBU1685294.1 DUF1624 domain-containing protein [Patescibacteria group bacterium]MBU1938347.1 DUF1624 domain-containing protein [Patescibacteria group bacterium]
MQEKRIQRLWELDALRGIAIVLMVLFHFIFDLRTFFGFDSINYYQGFWYYEGRVAAIIFIVLVGIVSSLIHQKEDPEVAMQKNSYRGLRLIGLGMIITLVTFIFARQDTIWFGILHFLGLSILISIPLCRYKWLNVILAVILFAGYYPIRLLYTNSYLGLIFGILPPGFSSFDHYALIPWLGYVLIGIALGNWIYADGREIIKRDPVGIEKTFAVTGRYSLWIYMIHQPVLLILMWLCFRLL